MKVDFGLELATLDHDDMDMVRAWRNDYRIWRWCRQSDLITDFEQGSWYSRICKDPTIKMYKILSRVDGERQPVGVCGLTGIDWINRRAEFSLYIAPEKQGRRFGKAALAILLQHAFQNLGLHQIWGETLSGNPASKTFEDLGFRHDGSRRQFYFKDGELHDAHLYSILRDEWITSLSQPSQPSSDCLSSETSPEPSGSCSSTEELPSPPVEVQSVSKLEPRRRRKSVPSPSVTSEPT